MHPWPSLPISTCWRWGEPSKKKSNKLGTPGAVAILKENEVQGCVSHNSDPEKSIQRKAGELRSNASAGHTIKLSERTWYQILSREKGHLKKLSKNVNLMSEIFARLNLRMEHLRRLPDKKIVPAKQHRTWREDYTSTKTKTKLLFILLWNRKQHRCLTPKIRKIVCLLSIEELQCTCWARKI